MSERPRQSIHMADLTEEAKLMLALELLEEPANRTLKDDIFRTLMEEADSQGRGWLAGSHPGIPLRRNLCEAGVRMSGRRVISLPGLSELAGVSEEEKLGLALELMREPVNNLPINDEIWQEYVDSAGPHGLSDTALEDLIDWLSFGTGTIITRDSS